MKSPTRIPLAPVRIMKQRGSALFFALICLVAIMLAAVTLVRSVDTSTMIAGNLAFQQSATRSGDGGTESAIGWLAGVDAANATKNVLTDPTHAFNVDNAAAGYYASLDPAKSLTAASGTRFLWDNTDSALLATDSSGNAVRYIIQRMCRTSGVAIKDTNCVFSGAALNNNNQSIPLPQEICSGPGCPVAGQTPQVRITSRVAGPKNTLSFVQAIIY
jgi:type IV pilus assembly protein PilX